MKQALSIVFLAVAMLAGCSKNGGDTTEPKTLYTCGMHPQVIQDHPGNCPICGMKLTPIRQQSTNAPAAGAVSQTITVEPSMIQNMGVRTEFVARGPLRRTVRTVGVIDYDEGALADVTTKFKGWIEKLDVDTTGQLVMRGDPLFEIYSPDLYSAEAEYLVAGSDDVRASARTKLKFLDMPDDQIAELDRTRKPLKAVRIVAPQNGFVTEKAVVQGQMVEAGARVFRLADLGMVWVKADIYEQDLVYLKLGQEAVVTLAYLPGREFRGRVTYIYPAVDEKTRTAQVRMEFHNPGYFLKPGMFATVQVTSELEPSALLAPDSAILRSGEKATVFVALDGGRFEPRTVTLGPQAEDDRYQILTGLEEGEKIVTSGQFMLDSESQLREAIQKMSAPGNAAAATNQAAAAAVTPEDARALKYICPMPEHVSIIYDYPGSCPICGMTLVPVSQATLSRLQPGGKLLYYTCPMPEHSDVRSDKPGRCPKCGMTLIPVMETPKSQ
jgi:multidrug efflux pump subunit AcrA (membrane-fusion protein)